MVEFLCLFISCSQIAAVPPRLQSNQWTTLILAPHIQCGGVEPCRCPVHSTVTDACLALMGWSAANIQVMATHLGIRRHQMILWDDADDDEDDDDDDDNDDY